MHRPVADLDHLRHFPNRSQAVETALAEKLERLSHARPAREAAKLDPAEEKALGSHRRAGWDGGSLANKLTPRVPVSTPPE
jgi:hypothetical protein